MVSPALTLLNSPLICDILFTTSFPFVRVRPRDPLRHRGPPGRSTAWTLYYLDLQSCETSQETFSHAPPPWTLLPSLSHFLLFVRLFFLSFLENLTRIFFTFIWEDGHSPTSKPRQPPPQQICHFSQLVPSSPFPSLASPPLRSRLSLLLFHKTPPTLPVELFEGAGS